MIEPGVTIRPLTLEDVPRLTEINTRFLSEATLRVDKIKNGLGATWCLTEVPLASPFGKANGYDFTPEDLIQIQGWMKRGQGLHLVAETADRLVALLDVEPQAWNHTAFVWNILVDSDYRGRGIGRALIERAIAWACAQGFRALSLETQSNNINACRFYHHIGFRLTGIRDDLYSNDDLAKGEVAVFWSYGAS